MASVSEAVQEKAIRYIMEGRIRPEITGAPIQSFLCDGEGTSIRPEGRRYRTAVGPDWSMCTCPASQTCCHRVGAELLTNLRRSDPVHYDAVLRRIVDRSARAQDPILPEDLLVA